jgi:hypothetical protein
LIFGAFHYFTKELDVNYPKIDSPKNISSPNFTPKNIHHPIFTHITPVNFKLFQNYTPPNVTPIKSIDFAPIESLLKKNNKDYKDLEKIMLDIGDYPSPSIPNIQNPINILNNDLLNNSINTSIPKIDIVSKNSILNQENLFDSKIKIEGSLNYE